MSERQVDVAQYYNNGVSWEQFVDRAQKNRGRMRKFYDSFDPDEDTLAFFNGRTPLQVLVIAEDWCPDVVQNVALLSRIADDVPGMEVSITARDDNPELMDAFLTDGKRRIPVIGFYDMTFRELGCWTGRCKDADDWIFGEILKDRSWADMTREEIDEFNAEYDRRFNDDYMARTIDEWQHLLLDEDF